MKLDFSQYGTTQNPKYLVIFLHGFGSNKDDLISLAPDFSESLLDALFIAPNAPFEMHEFFIKGFKWFSIDFDPNNRNFDVVPQKTAEEAVSANRILTSFIDQLLAKYNLTAKNLFLIGFSQGAMMSIYQALTREEEVAGVLAYSGRVVLPQDFKVADEIKSKPKVCLVHGKQDEVIHFSNFIQGKEKLEKLKVPFEAFEFDNLGHGINFAGIEVGKSFIKKILNFNK